MLGNLWQPDL